MQNRAVVWHFFVQDSWKEGICFKETTQNPNEFKALFDLKSP